MRNKGRPTLTPYDPLQELLQHIEGLEREVRKEVQHIIPEIRLRVTCNRILHMYYLMLKPE